RRRLPCFEPASLGRPSARATGRRARTRPRQGHRDSRRHPDQSARHRAPDDPPSPADRLGRQGAGDGNRLVGRRSVPVTRAPRRLARRAAAPARVEGGAPGRRGARMTETMTADALYAYAVVGPAGPEVRAALGPAFDLVGDDELAVVAGRVSLAEFGEDVLPKNLNDRPWLEAKARL